jgi:hypothetical protein
VTTRKDLVLMAFGAIGIGHTYDIEPEQLESARKMCDAMFAQWDSRGIRVGYPVPSSPNHGDIDDATHIPDVAVEAGYLQLAKRIAPTYGKQLTPETKALAREAYDTLVARCARPIEQQMPGGVPLGAGNRTFDGSPTFSHSAPDVLTTGGNVLEF